MHYQRVKYRGTTEARRRPSVEERFWAFVDQSTDCWLWRGNINPGGYGQFWNGARTIVAHRHAYASEIGPIPDGLQLDHLCRNRACCRPDHLEPVTQRENLMRGIGPIVENHRKIHCAHGHAFDEVNTYWDVLGKRHCRACRKSRNHDHWHGLTEAERAEKNALRRARWRLKRASH